MTGVSATTAFSTIVVGVVGDDHDRSSAAAPSSPAQMTLGDFVFYAFLTGLVAAPVVQIASIGTQISEAFAGLDRIREVLEHGDRGRGRRATARRSAAFAARSSSTT